MSGDLFTPSPRVNQPPAGPEYPYHDRSIRITSCSRICIGKRNINLSKVFAGQIVGIREVDDEIWLERYVLAAVATAVTELEHPRNWGERQSVPNFRPGLV